MKRVLGESKRRLIKAAGAESCGQRRNQKLHTAVAKSTFWSENARKFRVPEHFLKFRCRAAVEEHILKSKLKLRVSEHFLKFRCRKIHAAAARSAFSSQNAKKVESLRALFEVPMSKNCTPLWREAHFQVKMLKVEGLRAFFEVPMSKICAPLWREAHAEVTMLKSWGSQSTFWSSDVEKVHLGQSINWSVSQLVD